MESRVYRGVCALDSFLDPEGPGETEVQTLAPSLTNCVTHGRAPFPF